ncbi:MAG TPA: hypothetical protein GX392_08265 [Clostridiales bacterium]|nr:hypothetical protein [Clostridiales bacterium]
MLNNKGSTLATVVMMSSILLIFAVAFSTSVVADVSQSAKQQRNVEAHYIAMAGANAVSQKILSMNELERKEFGKLAFPLTSNETLFEDGSFTVTINDYPDQIEIKSIGKVRDTEATVVHILEKVESASTIELEIPFAIFAKGMINFGGGNIKGDIATKSKAEGAIKLNWGAEFVDANSIIVIPEGTDPNKIIKIPDWCNEFDNIKIEQKNIPDYPEPGIPSFPNFPSGLPEKGSIELSGAPGTMTISGDGYYDRISIAHSGKKLILNTGGATTRIRVGELSLNGGDKNPVIEIKGDGKVYIFVDNLKSFNGTVKAPDGAEVIFYIANSVGNVATLGADLEIQASLYFGDNIDVKIAGSCDIKGDIVMSPRCSISIAGGSEINLGTIYASNANIDFGGSGTINGNVMLSQGKSVKLPGGTAVNGVVYAPSADITFAGSGGVIGAVVGKDVSLTGGATVEHNDDSDLITIPIEVSDNQIEYKEGYWK